MNKTKKLIIVGAGEIGLLAYEFFTHDSDYEVVAFAVEQNFLKEETYQGLPLVAFETVEDKYSPKEYEAFVAISSQHLNRDRTRLYLKTKEKGYLLASYVSSDSSIWHNAKIGDNCFVLPKVMMQPFSEIKDNVFLWYGSNIGHHSVVEDNCFLASAGVAGFSTIGRNSFLGGYSCVGDNIIVAQDNYIAMGTFITKRTMPNSIYRGETMTRNKMVTAKTLCGVEEEE